MGGWQQAVRPQATQMTQPSLRRQSVTDGYAADDQEVEKISRRVGLRMNAGKCKIMVSSMDEGYDVDVIYLDYRRLLYTKISRISRIQAELQQILSQISLPWQRGLVAVEFVWHHSIARPRKPPVIPKDLEDISYIGRVIADFVPNFDAMATGVGAVEFAWHHSIARSRNTQRLRGYLLYRLSYSRVCPKFR